VVIDAEKSGLEDISMDEEVDAQGGVLLPELFDSHLHPTNLAAFGILSSYSVTTAFSMSS
jgi:predicted amidohydrolase YtcJ